MKKQTIAILTFLISISTLTAWAQTPTEEKPKEETQTLLGNLNKKASTRINYLGAYFAPEIQYGSIAGSFTPISGMSAMFLVNKKLALGMAAYETASDNFTPTSLGSSKILNMNAQYGGFKLEFTPKPNSVIHVSFPLLIGGGMANIDSVYAVGKNDKYENNFGFGGGRNEDDHGERFRDNEGRNYDGDNENVFFMVQPGIKLEANLFKMGKVFIGANYRIASGNSTLTATNPILIPKSSQLSGLGVNFGMKLGVFDFDVNKKRSFPSFRRHSRKHQVKSETQN